MRWTRLYLKLNNLINLEMDKVIHSKEIAQERVEWGKRYTYFKKNLLLVEESFLQCEEESLVEEVCLPLLHNASPPSSYS